MISWCIDKCQQNCSVTKSLTSSLLSCDGSWIFGPRWAGGSDPRPSPAGLAALVGPLQGAFGTNLLNDLLLLIQILFFLLQCWVFLSQVFHVPAIKTRDVKICCKLPWKDEKTKEKHFLNDVSAGSSPVGDFFWNSLEDQTTWFWSKPILGFKLFPVWLRPVRYHMETEPQHKQIVSLNFMPAALWGFVAAEMQLSQMWDISDQEWADMVSISAPLLFQQSRYEQSTTQSLRSRLIVTNYQGHIWKSCNLINK